MKRLSLALLFAATVALADDTSFLDLGTVQSADKEAPSAIVAAVRENPDVEYVVVTCISSVGTTKEHMKFVLDRRTNILILMKRLQMPVGDDMLSWSVWRQITEADLANGLPWRHKGLVMSPFGKDPRASLFSTCPSSLAFVWP